MADLVQVWREVESNRGGGVGGAPPPRSGCANGVLPHFVPLCNTIVVIRPTFLERWTDVRPESRPFQAFPRWERRPRGQRHAARMAAPIAGATTLASVRGPPYASKPVPPPVVGWAETGTQKGFDRCSEPPRSPSPAPCWRSPPPRAASRRAPAVTPTRRRSRRPAPPCTPRSRCSRPATGATTRSPPPASSCAPTIPRASCARRSTRRSPRRATASRGRRTSRRGSARTRACGPPTSRPTSRTTR